MPELVESTRRTFRDDRASPDAWVAEPTFADIAARYLERHVIRTTVRPRCRRVLYGCRRIGSVFLSMSLDIRQEASIDGKESHSDR